MHLLKDFEEFEHDYCHIFAIALNKLLGLQPLAYYIWCDEVRGKNILCHAYVGIANNVFLDASGSFVSIQEIESEFKYNYMKVHKFNTMEEYKQGLRTLKVRYGEGNIYTKLKTLFKNIDLICSFKTSKGVQNFRFVSYDTVSNTYVLRCTDCTCSDRVIKLPINHFIQTLSSAYWYRRAF